MTLLGKSFDASVKAGAYAVVSAKGEGKGVAYLVLVLTVYV